jgi:hypothetical protein
MKDRDKLYSIAMILIATAVLVVTLFVISNYPQLLNY